MLFIGVKKLEFPSGHIKIIPIIEIENIRINRRPYEIILLIEIEKIRTRFHGGHIEVMLFLEINIYISINQTEKLELTGGHIKIMLFLEIENIRINR